MERTGHNEEDRRRVPQDHSVHDYHTCNDYGLHDLPWLVIVAYALAFLAALGIVWLVS